MKSNYDKINIFFPFYFVAFKKKLEFVRFYSIGRLNAYKNESIISGKNDSIYKGKKSSIDILFYLNLLNLYPIPY